MFERKKEQNEAEHGESAIGSMYMYILVIPLGSVDSVLYPVFAPGCRQHMGFFTLSLRSSHSQHRLLVIESRESTPPMIGNPVRSELKPHRKVD